MCSWRFSMVERALRRRASGRAHRLGNRVDRTDHARPRLGLLLRRPGCVGANDGAARAPTYARRDNRGLCRSVTFPVSPDEIRWFRAFAGYRFGVITCFNVMLHRRGKRIDPQWEDTGRSAPRMFERGLELTG